MTDISKRGHQLFYRCDGREVPIERIYNRVIFDELLRRPELNLPFSFQEELDDRLGRSPKLVFPNQQTFVTLS